LRDYDAALRLKPRNSTLLTYRADTLAAQGEPARALADYDAALAISPQHAQALAGRDKARAALASRPTSVTVAESRPNSSASEVPSAPVLSDPEVRVALVIGNSNYQAVGRLPNPSRDADAVATALRAVGFTTVQVESDLGFDALRRMLQAFSAQAERADWAVIYYAGHGLEMNGMNYLVPVDAALWLQPQVLRSGKGARLVPKACRPLSEPSF